MAIIIIVIAAGSTMAIEEAGYRVITSEKPFEVRDYTPHIVAETIVETNLEDAGNAAFNILFGYISGENRSRSKIAMTAPVSQQPKGERIAMTAPVGQQPIEGKNAWSVTFMMPSGYTLDSLPVPNHPAITIRQVPPQRMAVVRYAGFWNEKGYRENEIKLEAWIRDKGYGIIGDPVWARYNPPFTPWFFRRNEILIPIQIEDPT
jgi:hypothetical protein